MEEEHRMSQARILKAQGHKQPEIAEMLGVTDCTVRNYLNNLPTPRKKHLTYQGKSEKESSSIRFNFMTPFSKVLSMLPLVTYPVKVPSIIPPTSSIVLMMTVVVCSGRGVYG